MLGYCEQMQVREQTIEGREQKIMGRGEGKGKLHRLWEGDVNCILLMVFTGDKELPC